MKFQENSWKSWNLWKFLIFEILEAPKPWYSLGIIGVFAMSWFSWNFTFSLKISIFYDFITFSTFLKNFNENAFFLKKRAHGAQDPPKCIVFHWFKQHSRQPAARVRKHDFSEKSKKPFPRFPWKNENFMKIMKFSRKSWFPTCQNHWYFLGNT